MKKLLFQLLLFNMVSWQCKTSGQDITCDGNNTLHLSSNAKSYFYFKQGSWWVYYNEAINRYDSLYVTSSRNDIRQPGDDDNKNKCYELVRLSVGNDTNRLRLNTDMDVSSDRTAIVERHRYDNGQLSDFELLFVSDSIVLLNDVRPYNIKLIDSTITQQAVYKNLIEIKSDKIMFDDFNYRLYGKNVGLIKFIDKKSNKWELIKYHINQ